MEFLTRVHETTNTQSAAPRWMVHVFNSSMQRAYPKARSGTPSCLLVLSLRQTMVKANYHNTRLSDFAKAVPLCRLIPLDHTLSSKGAKPDQSASDLHDGMRFIDTLSAYSNTDSPKLHQPPKGRFCVIDRWTCLTVRLHTYMFTSRQSSTKRDESRHKRDC
jgi:hypothetical protein